MYTVGCLAASSASHQIPVAVPQLRLSKTSPGRIGSHILRNKKSSAFPGTLEPNPNSLHTLQISAQTSRPLRLDQRLPFCAPLQPLPSTLTTDRSESTLLPRLLLEDSLATGTLRACHTGRATAARRTTGDKARQLGGKRPGHELCICGNIILAHRGDETPGPTAA